MTFKKRLEELSGRARRRKAWLTKDEIKEFAYQKHNAKTDAEKQALESLIKELIYLDRNVLDVGRDMGRDMERRPKP